MWHLVFSRTSSSLLAICHNFCADLFNGRTQGYPLVRPSWNCSQFDSQRLCSCNQWKAYQGVVSYMIFFRFPLFQPCTSFNSSLCFDHKVFHGKSIRCNLRNVHTLAQQQQAKEGTPIFSFISEVARTYKVCENVLLVLWGVFTD